MERELKGAGQQKLSLTDFELLHRNRARIAAAEGAFLFLSSAYFYPALLPSLIIMGVSVYEYSRYFDSRVSGRKN